MRSTEIRFIDYLWLFLIATLSFLVSGLPFYPFLNSDIAIHVLMTESFSFQYDLYFWGQDRLGSLLPLVANIVHRISGISPFWLTALTKWLFLCMGCVSFWYFIPNRFQRWVWTSLWFFPAYEMMYHLLPGHPYAEQMAMFGLSLIFFCRWVNSSSKPWNLPLLIIFATISFWISDFSLVFYLALLVSYFSTIKKRIKQLFSNPLLIEMKLTSLVFVIATSFILYAKLTSARDETYTLSIFGSGDQILYSISMIWFYTKNVLLIDSVSVCNSIYFYATLASIILLVVNRKKLRFKAYSNVCFIVSILGFLLIVSLRWLAINFVMLKYFIPVFFSLWLGILSVDWSCLDKKLWLISKALMVMIVIGCSGSLIYQYHHPSEHKLTQAELQTHFFQTPKVVIGNYWYSYVFGIINPKIITATPHEKESVRNWKQVGLVMQSDTIHICLNNWLDSPPEKLIQFNTKLHLIDTLNEGQFRFARYKKIRKI